MPKPAQLPYNPKLKARARELRKHSTLGEVLLWQQLKGRQRAGGDFHRQRPVDEFILDFFCPELWLAIEIDGGSPRLKGAEDELRQRRLESLGVNVLRFDEKMVRRNLEGVVEAIGRWIAGARLTHPASARQQPSPSLRLPSPAREGIRLPERP